MDIDLPLASTSTTPANRSEKFGKILLDKETQTVPVNIEQLRRKVKTLKQKVNRKNLKIRNMKEVISTIKKSGHSNENLDIVLEKYFEGIKLIIFMNFYV